MAGYSKPPEFAACQGSMTKYRENIDLWARGQHKLDPSKVAAKVLAEGFNQFPDIKERARQECVPARLDAKKWRGHVNRAIYGKHNWKQYRSAFATGVHEEKALHDSLIEVEAMKLGTELGLPEGQRNLVGLQESPLGMSAKKAVIARAKVAVGDTFVAEPQAPKVNLGDETESIESGDHEVFGTHSDTDADGNRITYGDKRTCGIDYLLDTIEGTQSSKPIYTWLQRWRTYLSVRRNGREWMSFLNEFNIVKHQFLGDTTVNLGLPGVFHAFHLFVC